FIARIRDLTGDILAFSSGHVTRMIAARWLGLPPGAGRFFYCRPASVGVLAYEHDSLEEPIIFKWNYMRLPREGSRFGAAIRRDALRQGLITSCPAESKGSRCPMGLGPNPGKPDMNILLLNAGSSSLKCALMESAHGRVGARGLADWAGSETYYRYAGSD